MKDIYKFLSHIQEKLGGAEICDVSVSLRKGLIVVQVDWIDNDYHARMCLSQYAKYLPPHDMWADYLVEKFENDYKMWEVGEI